MSGTREFEAQRQKLLEDFTELARKPLKAAFDDYIAFYKNLYEKEALKPYWSKLYDVVADNDSKETLDFFVDYLKLTNAEKVSTQEWKTFSAKWIYSFASSKGTASSPTLFSFTDGQLKLGDQKADRGKTLETSFDFNQKLNLVSKTQQKLKKLSETIVRHTGSEVDLGSMKVDLKSISSKDEKKELTGREILDEAAAELLGFINSNTIDALMNAKPGALKLDKKEKKEKKPEGKEKKELKPDKEEKKKEKEEKAKAKKEAKEEKEKEKKEKKEEGRRLKF